jgi:hypothetical protein
MKGIQTEIFLIYGDTVHTVKEKCFEFGAEEILGSKAIYSA